MIELISIDNWLCLKNQLRIHYQRYQREMDSEVCYDFKGFVESVFAGVLYWNSFNSFGGLDPIDNDDELALDLLDAIYLLEDESIRDEDLAISVSYIDSLGAVIIEAYPKPEMELRTEETYKIEMQKLKTQKLTILARLLDVVRQSKSGE